MNLPRHYQFNLPPEESVIQRNRTITTYYAQLYQRAPHLYKWAGMAAFASFHIGEKLQLWDWQHTGIKTLSATCKKQNLTIEDDFQIIRIINNQIFAEIGGDHLGFRQMEFPQFKKQLVDRNRHPIIIAAFEKLHEANLQLESKGYTPTVQELIWEANTDILWHEQSEVVQPLFNKLSDLFSGAMTLFASFDYKINHHPTTWKAPSRFVLFMLFQGFHILKQEWQLPRVTKLQHRWHWILNDLLKKWKVVEANSTLIATEIDLLSKLEERNLIL